MIYVTNVTILSFMYYMKGAFRLHPEELECSKFWMFRKVKPGKINVLLFATYSFESYNSFHRICCKYL